MYFICTCTCSMYICTRTKALVGVVESPCDTFVICTHVHCTVMCICTIANVPEQIVVHVVVYTCTCIATLYSNTTRLEATDDVITFFEQV